MRWILALALLALTPGGALAQALVPATGDGEEVEFSESVDLSPPDDVAWQEPGFRLSLTYAFMPMVGQGGVPDYEAHGFELGVGARLDARWSLMTRMTYAFVSPGIAFTTLLEPTWHPWRGLSVGLGVGVGGLIAVDGGDDPNAAEAATIPASLTYEDTDEGVLGGCDGYGPAASLRVGYTLPMGQSSALTLGVRAGLQRTGCEQSTDRVEPDTAEEIVRRQWWTHATFGVVGGFVWR